MDRAAGKPSTTNRDGSATRFGIAPTGRRRGIAVIILIAAAVLSLILAGCSNSEATNESTSTSASSSSAAPSTTGDAGSGQAVATSEMRQVVGGKSAEEYAAEIPELEKAVEANPNDLAALQELAVAQYNSANYEGAAATYEKMLKIKDDPTTHNNYGNVLRDWKKTAEAKAEYEKAIAGDAALTVAYINLAGVYAAEKDLDGALEVLDRGIKATAGEDQQRLKDYQEKLKATTTTTT